MEFRILGPLEVRDTHGAVALGGAKPRAVLAVLLLHPNEPVSAERLALALWGEDAPSNAVKTVQVHVSRLRKALGEADRIATTPAGYCLRVGSDELDAQRFELLVDDGRRALAGGRAEHAAVLLAEALSLWRGRALDDVAYEPFAQTEIARLEEQRLGALEARVEADLAAGRHGELLGELRRLLTGHPTRERLAGQMMRALYCSGRQAEALEVYRVTRRELIDDVGVEPGPELRRLQEAILRQDASLEPQERVPELPPELDVATARPLLGRERELAWLREQWEQARTGTGALITLIGVPGIGKSRLAAELAGDAHRTGARVLFAGGGGPADGVLGAIADVGQATRPTLLVLAEADRAGAGVLTALDELVGSLADLPVLVLATADTHDGLEDRAAAAAITLEPLDAEAVSAIAADYRGGRSEGLPGSRLLEATGGIPGRVHEVAGQWARREAARRVEAAAGRAAAGRVELRSMEAELTGDVVELQAARERTERPTHDAPMVCPFKGLASFDVADAEYFFGRERLIAELVARLVGAPLLAVVGPSGSGKSSVTKAGLLPALASGVLPGSDGRTQVLIRPGEHPMRELLEATAALDPAAQVVIAVDQFEEIFTTCRDEQERSAFIAQLVTAATDRKRRTVVVIALRADFYGRCGTYPGLAELVAANHVLVGAMRSDELRRAIERPALRVGLRVDPDLADALVADVKDEPGALPLLSTALLDLWQRRDGRRLRFDAYDQTGGVRGAVARLAEDAFAQLDERSQVVARRVLMRLAVEGEAGTVERRRVALAELDIEHDEDAASVVALLTDRRMLTVSGGTIEFAHEALLREWPRLRDWIDEDRDGLRLQRSLSAGAQEWERLGRDEGALYRGIRLGEVSQWNAARNPTLNTLERDFLEASEARRTRERAQRRRRVVLAFAGLITVIVAISIVAIVSISRSREAREQRDLAASRAIAARSGDFVVSDPRLSLTLAFEALQRARTEPAQNALRQATLASRTRTVSSASRTGSAFGIAVSRNGALLATTGDDGAVRVRRTGDSRLVTTIAPDPRTPVEVRPALAASFSPSGRTIAIASVDGTVAVADVRSGRRSSVLRLKEDLALTVEFSPDGTALLIATDTGVVGILPLRNGAALRPLPASGSKAERAYYSADGTRVVAASRDGALRIWSSAGGAPTVLPAGTPLNAGAVSPVDSSVAAVDEDGYLRIWELDQPRSRPRKILVDRESLFSVRFSADGQRIVTGSENGVLRVMDVRGGPPLAELRGHFGPISDAAFLRGDDDVVSVGYDGTLRRWNLLEVTRPSGSVAVGRPSLSADRTRVASAFADGVVRIWNRATGRMAALPSTEKTVLVAYSGDGTRVAGASDEDRVRMWDVSSGRSRAVPSFEQEVYALALDRDGSRVAIATLDNDTIIQRADGRQRHVLRGHDGDVNAIAFSPDDRYLVTASEDKNARIFDARTRRLIRILPHSEAVIDARYSDDGRSVATAATDGTVRIWPVAGGPPVLLYGHVGQVNSVAFDHSAERLVSAGADRTVRVWDTAGGEALTTLLSYRRNALGAAFSADGKEVIGSEDKGPIQSTRCEVCRSVAEVLTLARSRAARPLTSSERQRLLADDG